ncbi:HNH endonuclease [Halomonas binhaiensis]|uniref:HNH endonuclease n=1 Tax=Halomonas binhaiensis TaxID=2562282 RepID=A0A5C1NJW9_9GAMM|nr:HNH endonuclease [Halomonas binhaiensis]QEM82688.1 HNH endonuclease [Halomonas binhaiensis]
MNYWWVNQNQTYQHEVHGGYLWSPKTNANGARNRFYDAMTEVSTGDIVFSFCDTQIKAIGIVSGSHQSSSKPDEFGIAGAAWSNDGWYVPVAFNKLANPIRPKDHIDFLAPALPAKYSPLQANGNGNQGVYLAPVPQPLAEGLISLLGGQVEAILEKASSSSDAGDNIEINHILENTEVTTTQRTQLIQARIGQGLFRSRVAELEPRCRVTGIEDIRFLVASHIKPWSKCTNEEKLDGHNGLLLTPHIDHLFDKGYITFDDAGQIKISNQLPASVQQVWELKPLSTPVALTERQKAYMDYHREHIFRG